jgi:hypothetical protein
MAYTLIDAAQARWRAVNAPHLVARRPRRRRLPQEQTARTTRRHHTAPGGRINRNGGRLKHPDPQVLTIPRSPGRGWIVLGLIAVVVVIIIVVIVQKLWESDAYKDCIRSNQSAINNTPGNTQSALEHYCEQAVGK